MQMHKITTIAKRDYIATVRTKAFVFGLVVAPLLFGGGSIAMTFFKGQPDLKDRRVAIVDHTGVVAGPLVSAAREKNDRELFDKKTPLVPHAVGCVRSDSRVGTKLRKFAHK